MDPSPTPETTPPPAVKGEASNRGRNNSWMVLCMILILPLWSVVALLSVLVVERSYRLLDQYSQSSLLLSSEFYLLGSFIFTAILVGFLARLGIKRGWNSAKGLRRGWGIAAVLIMVIFTGCFILFRHGRQSSIDKHVLSVVRGLSAAADQYFVENGVSTVSVDMLVGATNYVKAINPYRAEIYPVFYTQGITITVTGVEGVRTVTYAP